MSAARRARRQWERDEEILRRLALGWTTRQDGTLTQRERRVLRRNGRKVEHPREGMLRFAKRVRRMREDGTWPTRVISRESKT